jgi:hypothetical protein
MVFLKCFIIKQRNVPDSSAACLSVAGIADSATWAVGVLAATLAVDLLLIYYLHRAQLDVRGDHIVSGEGEPAGGGVVDEAVSAPLLPNDANDADEGVVEVYMEVRRRTARSSVGSAAGSNMKFGSTKGIRGFRRSRLRVLSAGPALH